MSDGSYRGRHWTCFSYIFSCICSFAPGNGIFPSNHLETASEPQEHQTRDSTLPSFHCKWSHLCLQYLFLGGGYHICCVCLSFCILSFFFITDCLPICSVIFLQHEIVTLSKKSFKGLSFAKKEILNSWVWRSIPCPPCHLPSFQPGHSFLFIRLLIPQYDNPVPGTCPISGNDFPTGIILSSQEGKASSHLIFNLLIAVW